MAVVFGLMLVSCHGGSDAEEFFYGDTIRAECPTGQTLKYVVVNANTNSVQLFGFNDNLHYQAGPLVIPGRVTYHGQTFAVESIRKKAFKRCEDITEVTIDDRITEVNRGVFKRCTGIRRVHLPAGMKEIPQSLFARCESYRRLCVQKVSQFEGCRFS